MSTAVTRIEPQSIVYSDRLELTVEEIVAKVAKVREVAAKVMKEDIHYGTIPGTPKPTLYKAGGEILALTFRLAPKYEEQRIDLGHGHIEYKVTCNLFHIHTQEFYGSGLGSCSTMENKYRYRPGPVNSTGRAVPKEYWEMRSSDPAKAQQLLGGSGFKTKKVDGQWQIVEQGETIENPNPADQYNTVLKMAGKRAYVDAILKATAASEVYTQDLEDMIDNDQAPAEQTKSISKPQAPNPVETRTAPESHLPQCPKCRSNVKLIPSGIAKTGKNIGKPYPEFYACQNKECKHTWRPEPEQKPVIESYGESDPLPERIPGEDG